MMRVLQLQLMQANNKPRIQAKEPATLIRNKKSDLAKQFQEFKQRIQEFQDKNEEIINRIRQTYSFKKKNIDTRQLPYRFPTQVYHQPHPYNENQSDYSSCDLSQKIVYQGNIINQNSRIRAYEPQYYNQAHYKTNYKYLEDQNNHFAHEEKPGHSIEVLAKGQKQFLKNLRGHKTMMHYDHKEHEEPKNRNIEVRQQTGKFFNQQTIQQLENRLQQVLSQNSVLEHQIQAREQQINRIKANELKQRSYVNITKKTLEEEFYKYEENIVAPKLEQIQRYIRKCCNRMKNMLHRIKDQAEERRAHKAIQRSREKRRLSGKLKEPNSSTSSVDMKDSSVSGPPDLPRPSASRSTSNLKRPQNKSQIRSKQKQFEQIAFQYEKMIKNKVDQIQQLQRKLKLQLSQKQKLSNQIRKCHKMLEEKAETAKNGNSAKKQERGQPQDFKQVKELKQKVFNLQLLIKQKQNKEKQLLNSMQKLQKSKKQLFQQQKQSYNKSLVKKNEAITYLEEKIKKIQNNFFQDINELKQKNYIGQKQLMQKDIQNMGMINKIKKLEADLFLKDQKFKQLEKLILKQNDQSQLLEKSISIDTSFINHTDFKHLQQTLKKLQQELEEKINRIYLLERQVQKKNADLDISHQQNQKQLRNIEILQKRINQINKETDSKMLQVNEKQSARLVQQKEMILEQFQESQKELLQEKQQLLEKNRSLLQDLKKFKDQNLNYNREIIKLNSQISFSREEYQSVLQKYTKTKEQITETRLKLAEQDSQFKEKEKNYIHQIKNLQIQIQNLTNHISELEAFEKAGQEKYQENLLNSLHVSEASFHLNNKRYNQEQHNALKDRIKELQVQIQMKEQIEKEMQNEYKLNLERIRSQTSQKGNQLHNYVAQINDLKKQLQKALQQKKDDVSFQNYKISLYEEKIVQLENQYNISRQSEQRLNDLLHQLMQSTKEKSEQKNRLIEELQLKDRAIQEMKQLLELKTIIKDKGKQESNWNLLRSSGDQSEQISDIAQLSYLSNISDVFKKDDVLQQKMRKGKTSREQFVKLFTKTSAYIKTLKQLIQNKDKRIRTLQKQVCSLKNNHNNSWCGGSNQRGKKDVFRFSKTQINEDRQEEYLQQFKDYESLQLDTRRTRSYELIKQLQKEKQLIVEQNNMLSHQVEALQDQLVKAEEQENSLVRIKDLYKDEIKKLMEKNQAHNKEFEIQINKMKQELESSVSFHNWEALKQFVYKIISSFAALQDINQKVKREQRKKQIEEYLKVMSCIVALQTANKNGQSTGKK